MELVFKKEVKHSVVYETDAKDVPVQSVYVKKLWLVEQNITGNTWPKKISLEVKVL